MKNIIILIAAWILAIEASNVYSDQALLTCQILAQPHGSVPAWVGEYLKKYSLPQVRQCEEPNGGAKRYYGLGPIQRVHGVCQFIQTYIDQDIVEPPDSSVVAMTSEGGGVCPMYDSNQYAFAYHVSADEFLEISALIKQALSSEKALLAMLPGENNSEEVVHLVQDINKKHPLYMRQVARMSGFFSLYNNYEITIRRQDDREHGYAIRVQKVLWMMSIKGISSLII